MERGSIQFREKNMPATRDDLMAFLKELGIEVATTDHEPVFTVAESGDLHERIPGGHTKNLFLKDKKGRLFLVVALHDADIDLKKIHQVIGAQGRVSFGNADLLMEVLGVEPGSVTPFSLINDRQDHRVTPVFDAAMMRHEILNYHPLKNDATTSIAAEDLLKFAGACGHDAKVLPVSDGAKAAAAPDGQ
ncbi:MAG: prolyl-tRNA synthetase associated domain-containing protein [Roseibium sp.]